MDPGLSYLASPVLYVGVVHASLCDWLQTSATVANLPATAYLIMSPLPLLVAWLFPYARYLKPVMVGCYAALAAVNALMVVVLLLSKSTEVIVAAWFCKAPSWAEARTVAVAFEFEVLGRAVSPHRRGAAARLWRTGPFSPSSARRSLSGYFPASLGHGRCRVQNRVTALFAASVPVVGEWRCPGEPVCDTGRNRRTAAYRRSSRACSAASVDSLRSPSFAAG